MGSVAFRKRCAWVVIAANAAIAAVAARSSTADFSSFTNEASSRGVTYLMATLTSGGVTSGQTVGFADLDMDMDMDIVCLGKGNNEVGIFENLGGGQFANRSATSGIPGWQNPSTFAAGDYDADGDLDLVITTWGHGIHLMRNDGGFTFTEVTEAAGLSEFAATRGVSWGDLDGDGWIDMFVCNYMNAIPNTANAKNRLWRNNGDGTFTDKAAALGLADSCFSFMSALFDADMDGDLDIYISNDRATAWPFIPNRFLRNDGGVFTDIGAQNGTNLAFFSMGIACGDLDGNGLPDLYCTNLPSPVPPMLGENPLLLQQPGRNYVLSQGEWGVAVKKTSWNCTFFDVDNDADTDLYVINQLEANMLFEQRAAPPMVNIGSMVGLAGPSGTVSMDYCASVADVDDDGDLDIIQNNMSLNVRLFINNEGSERTWARFLLVGERHDTRALGATVRVRTGDKWQMRQLINGANGFLPQNDGLLHFGLNAATMMDEILVLWPNTGTTRTLTNYPASKRWRLIPPSKMGDSNFDGVVNQLDLTTFARALALPFAPGQEAFDFDGDGALSASDTQEFLSLFKGKRGDIDANGVVDGKDLGDLLLHWGPVPSAFDLDLDGRVSGSDLGILLANWG